MNYLLTGATGHLGREMLLLVRDWNVICVSRRSVDLSLFDSSLAEELLVFEVDISDIAVDKVVDMIESTLFSTGAKLSGLVNNAYYLDVSSYDDMSADSCDSALRGIFEFHVNLTLGLMKRHLFAPSSSVVNVSSMYAKVAPDPSVYPQGVSVNPLLYGSMKAALCQATRYLSAIMAPQGVRVNSVSYGPFPSGEVQDKSPDFIRSLAAKTHLGRIGSLRVSRRD